MCKVTFKGKTFDTDSLGFLKDYRDWSEEFAAGIAPDHGISGGLTEMHLQVILFIRNALEEYGRCPLVFQTCKANNLRLRQLKELFPTGYLRGACKLAGLTYREGYLKHYTYLPLESEEPAIVEPEKIYRIDVRGFLIDPGEWDEQYALFRSYDLKVPGNLTDKHWEIIRFLRKRFSETGAVPTVYETCEAFNLDIEEFGGLFPDGYHRGAVKLAGLRVR